MCVCVCDVHEEVYVLYAIVCDLVHHSKSFGYQIYQHSHYFFS